MENSIPSFLTEKLSAQYPAEEYERILAGYQVTRNTSFRRNTMKIGREDLEQALTEASIPFTPLSWYEDGYVSAPGMESALQKTDLFENGQIYLQNPSSMLPPLMLSPGPGQEILDMCAAPGSKTTELYALSGGRANITACEKDRIRADRLRFNLRRQGASRVNVLVQDARKLDDLFRFDGILLDAPCSGTGTVLAGQPKSYSSLSELLVKNSSKLQTSLISKAARLLSAGGQLVYSTCSLLKEENEDIVVPLIRKGIFEVASHPEIERSLPLLSCGIPGGILVCPTETYEGFFAVHLRKI